MSRKTSFFFIFCLILVCLYLLLAENDRECGDPPKASNGFSLGNRTPQYNNTSINRSSSVSTQYNNTSINRSSSVSSVPVAKVSTLAANGSCDIDSLFSGAHAKISWPDSVVIDLMFMVDEHEFRLLPYLVRSLDLFWPPHFNIVALVEKNTRWSRFFLPQRVKVRVIPTLEKQGIDPRKIKSRKIRGAGYVLGNIDQLWADNFTSSKSVTHIALMDVDAILSVFITPELLLTSDNRVKIISCANGTQCWSHSARQFIPALEWFFGNLSFQSDYMYSMPYIFPVEVFRKAREVALAHRPEYSTFTQLVVNLPAVGPICQMCALGYIFQKYFPEKGDFAMPQLTEPAMYYARHMAYDILLGKLIARKQHRSYETMSMWKLQNEYAEAAAQVLHDTICVQLPDQFDSSACHTKYEFRRVHRYLFQFEIHRDFWRDPNNETLNAMYQRHERVMARNHFTFVKNVLNEVAGDLKCESILPRM